MHEEWSYYCITRFSFLVERQILIWYFKFNKYLTTGNAWYSPICRITWLRNFVHFDIFFHHNFFFKWSVIPIMITFVTVCKRNVQRNGNFWCKLVVLWFSPDTLITSSINTDLRKYCLLKSLPIIPDTQRIILRIIKCHWIISYHFIAIKNFHTKLSENLNNIFFLPFSTLIMDICIT